MVYFTIKLFVSAGIIVLASEIAKKFPKIGGLIISLPITSILAIIWLYKDTKDIEKVKNFSWEIFLFIFPSLTFFLSLILFLKLNFNFILSLVLSILLTLLSYSIYYKML